MRTLPTASVISALALAPLAAQAAPPAKPAAAPAVSPGAADARCLLSMVVLSQDKQRQQAASIGTYFFAGRLTARGLDIKTAVKAAEATMKPQEIPDELKRCGPMVQASMRSLQETFAPPPGTTAPSAAGPAGSPPGAAAPAAAPPAPAAAPPIVQTPK